MSDKEDDKLFDIDPDKLDEEWLRQSRLYRKRARRLAECRDELERAEAACDVVEAELDRDVRRDPQRFDVQKVTEGVVERTVLLQPRYQAAHERWLKAKFAVDIAYADVKSLDHKKNALEFLTILRNKDYYSAPRVPAWADESTRERMADAEKAAVRSKGRRNGA